MRFRKKMASRVKKLREELRIPQQELAKLAGVSRQTIYFLEKGSYNPKLTLSFKIAEILKKPIEDIFYLEPVIKDAIESKTIREVKEIVKNINLNLSIEDIPAQKISAEKISSLSELKEHELANLFSKDELIKISEGLGFSFEELFEED